MCSCINEFGLQTTNCSLYAKGSIVLIKYKLKFVAVQKKQLFLKVEEIRFACDVEVHQEPFSVPTKIFGVLHLIDEKCFKITVEKQKLYSMQKNL